MENVKEIIAKNLVELRKSRKYTQQQLAEKLNYSDKAISRWEHAESLPDIETLCKICDIYGVKFEYLLQEEQPKRSKNPYVVQSNTGNKIAITLIAASSVWMVAVLIYFYTTLIYKSNLWTTFIWAIPVTGLVVQFCNRLWGTRLFKYIIISFNAWTIILAVYLQLLSQNHNAWMLFILGIPIQVIIFLAATLKRGK
ncbi:MAG: helix-turn-helix transcriptional regulator [Clostridia bacterium]|nr:helix-turn-helix transcriptional regulator [Clostridia bacterium]